MTEVNITENPAHYREGELYLSGNPFVLIPSFVGCRNWSTAFPSEILYSVIKIRTARENRHNLETVNRSPSSHNIVHLLLVKISSSIWSTVSARCIQLRLVSVSLEVGKKFRWINGEKLL